ncbi:RCC1 domain-containing protein 1 isoform X3 [Larus michahellis]|uniref:RCC1 domain-containing protein 1 isoform X3 n=1 Tax=Larus michahellis TaxID=119627 RepID=UPI003D9B7688
MAAPRRAWLVFGFSTEEAAGEPGPGPGPRRLESGPEGIRRLWPAWSYLVVETGAGLELRSAGLRRRLRGWAEALPSETHLVLRGPAGARAWRRAAALRGELRGEPAWSRALPPEPRRPPPLPLLPGGGFATPRPPFFAPLPAGVRARRLALGHEHALALGDAGQVHAWGGGRHGQLGHGTLESELQPRLVEALAGVPMQAVAAGGWHSASVSEAGDLYVWGWNESGQLALPSKALAEERVQDGDAGAGDTMLTPRQEQPAAEGTAFISIQAFPALLDLPQDLEVTEVSCGSRHTAVVTRGGELYTWGWGFIAELFRGFPAAAVRTGVLSHFLPGPQRPGEPSPREGRGHTVARLWCPQANTGSWDTGTTAARTSRAASTTWWPRACRRRKWCAGPGPPTSMCWSHEGPKVPPPPHGCLWRGRHGRALLLHVCWWDRPRPGSVPRDGAGGPSGQDQPGLAHGELNSAPGAGLVPDPARAAATQVLRTTEGWAERIYYICFSIRAVVVLCAAYKGCFPAPLEPHLTLCQPLQSHSRPSAAPLPHQVTPRTHQQQRLRTRIFIMPMNSIESHKTRGQNLENK